MSVIRTLFVTGAMVAVTGCQTLRDVFVNDVHHYHDKPYTHAPLGLEPPAPLVFEPVAVILVAPEGEKPYFMLDSESYKNLILNNKKIEGYISESTRRIDGCEAYYTRPLEQ